MFTVHSSEGLERFDSDDFVISDGIRYLTKYVIGAISTIFYFFRILFWPAMYHNFFSMLQFTGHFNVHNAQKVLKSKTQSDFNSFRHQFTVSPTFPAGSTTVTCSHWQAMKLNSWWKFWHQSWRVVKLTFDIFLSKQFSSNGTTETIEVFSKCFHSIRWIQWQKKLKSKRKIAGLESRISCVRDRDSTTVPQKQL